MDTVKKGNKFEEVCFKIIYDALHNKKLGLNPEQCRVFQKKGYYSRDRQKNIIFDLSIEVWLPDSKRFSFIYIIECKDYSSKKVPVDDIEEFYSKVTQVAGVNTKAIVLTSNTYQDGAYTFASSKGIMLIEVNSNITYNIILHKTNRNYEKGIEDRHIQNGSNEVSLTLKKQLNTKKVKRIIESKILQGFIGYLNKTSNNNFINLPKYSREHIEEISANLINSYNVKIIKGNLIMNMDGFVLYLNKALNLTISFADIKEKDENGREILSYCSFLDKKIVIDNSLNGSRRYGFILAHEIGHFILHNKVQIDQKAYEKLSDSKPNFSLDKYLLVNDRNWIEWQANQFAASLIMPASTFYSHFSKIQDEIGLQPGSQLYVDDQQCNLNSFHKIIGKLALHFNTTKTSVIYRLNSLGLLNKNHDIKHVRQIIINVMEKYLKLE